MARIDLRKSSGLPIQLDGDNLITQEMKFKEIKTYEIGSLRSQLLNNEVTCPEIFFKKYCELDNDNIYKNKKLSINVYTVMPNLAGIEYVKTKANVIEKYNRIIEIVQGGGVAICQNFNNQLEGDILISNLKKGQKAVIPAGYEFSMSNTKSPILVFIEYVIAEQNTVDVLDDINGMSYYVIRKNAKQEIVRNPEYRLAGKPRKINWEKVLNDRSITSKTPLIKQILRKYEKFDWLFSQDPFAF